MITNISLSQIIEVDNYRSEYPADHIAGLADSMRKFGFKEEFAVTVQKLDAHISGDKSAFVVYGLVKGHCRVRAAREAGLDTIPCHVTTETAKSALMLDQLGENENRRDPSDIDRANGYQRALDTGATMADLCAAIGKRADYVNRRLALLKLVPEAQQLVATKQLPLTAAGYMVELDTNFQRIALKAYNQRHYTVDEFSGICNGLLEKQRTCSLFDLALFNGQPIELTLDTLKIERPKSRAELEAELQTERKARQADREFAKRKYTELLASYRQVLGQLEQTA